MERLLYIAHRVPYPPDKGERLRAFHEIAALAKHFRITLAALAHSPADAQSAEQLRPWCQKVLLAPAGGKLGLLRGGLRLLRGGSVTEGYFHSRHLEREIAQESARAAFDLVFAYCSSVLPLALAVPADAHVVDLVDVDSAKWDAYAAESRGPKRWVFGREAQGVRKLESLARVRCDAVFVVSEDEAGALGERSPRLLAVGNGVDSEYFSPPTSPRGDGPPMLVFTGSMDYRPNVDAVCWFAREVWPELKHKAPELAFTIVGRDPARPVRDLARQPGIVVTGSVPDVRPYLGAAIAAVAPLRIARGVQNKVLEAMAMAKPVVASSAALEGLDVEVGSDALRADLPQQWTEHILRLLADAPYARALGSSGRKCVLERYTWPARMRPLVDTCLKLAARPQSAAASGEGRPHALPGRDAALSVEGSPAS